MKSRTDLKTLNTRSILFYMKLPASFAKGFHKKSKERDELVRQLKLLRQKLASLKKQDKAEESKIHKAIAKQKLLIKQYDISERVKQYGGDKK